MIDETFLIKAMLAAVITAAAMMTSGCINGYAGIGGPETLTIYKDMQLELARIENETERKRR